MTLIIFCFSTEVMFDHVSISETPRLRNCHFQIVTTKGRWVESSSVCEDGYTVKKIGLKLSLCLSSLVF